MKLHNKKSYLVSQNEGRPKKRFWPRVTQLLYIIFIVFIFLYVIYFFVARSFYVTTDGIIEVSKQRVAATHGGKLEQFTLTQGDTFNAGDKLAVVGASRYCKPPGLDTRSLQLSFNIKNEEIDLDGLNNELSILRRFEEQMKTDNTGLRRALEINAPLLSSSQSSSIKILEKQNEIAIQRARINNMKMRLQQYKNAPIEIDNDPKCTSETILAPFDGYVFSTTFTENEVINRGETIMTIVADTAKVNIEIYLENQLFDSVQPKQTFNVTLPNGTNSEAVVSEIFSSAITQAERAYEDYQPVIPQLKAHLVPVNEADIQMWKQYDRYRVNVEGLK